MTNGNDGAYYRKWISLFMFMLLLLLLLLLFICVDCITNIVLSRQTDEFGTDFNGLPVRRYFDTDFNGLSVRRNLPSNSSTPTFYLLYEVRQTSSALISTDCHFNGLSVCRRIHSFEKSRRCGHLK
jgi:hypothetical protein